MWRHVLFTGTAFGSAALLSKGLIDDGVDPFMVSWVPFMAGGVVAVLAGMRRGELRASGVAPGVVLGLMSSAAPAILFNSGFDRLPAGIVTLLISIAPVFTAIVAHFVFADERFNPVKAAGLALAVVGVGILAVGPGSDGEGSVSGIVIVLIGTVAAGTGAVLTRVFALRHGAVSLIGPQLIAGGVAPLVLTPLLGRGFGPDTGFEAWHIPSMILMGVVASYFGFRSMLAASEIGTTGQVSVVSYMIPLYGVVGGVLIFGDEPSAAVVLGGLLILVAVGVIGRGSRGAGLPPELPSDPSLPGPAPAPAV